MANQIKNETNNNSNSSYPLSNSNLSNDSFSISLDSIPRRRKRFPIILFTIVALLVATVAFAFFNKTANNYISMKLLSPSKYLAKVENNKLDEFKKSPVKKMIFANNTDSKNGTTTPYSFEFKLSDSVKSLVSTYAKKLTTSDKTLSVILEEIINKTESVTIEGSLANKEGDYSFVIGFKQNDEELIKANVVIEVKEKDSILYVQVPTLSEKWISYKLDSDTSKVFSNSTTLKDKISKLSYKDIIERYLKIVVNNLENVKKHENTSLQINKYNQSCTLLDCELTKENASNIVIKMVEELKKDDELKDILLSLNLAKDAKDLDKKLDSKIEDFKKQADKKDKLASVKVWVDSQGNVIGHEFSNDEGLSVGYKTVTDDKTKEFVYYLSLDKNFNHVKYQYEGSIEKNDDAISGDSVLTIEQKNNDKNTSTTKSYLDSPSGKDKVSIDIKYEDYKITDDGLIDGKLNISSDDLYNINLDMQLKADGSSQVAETNIKALSTFEVGTLTTKTSTENSANIQKPSESIEYKEDSQEQILSYFKTIDITKLTNNLKKSVNSDSFSDSLDKFIKSSGLDKLNGKQSLTDLQKIAILMNK